MSEVAIPEPLSGSEIIEAIVSRVRNQLSKDCFLTANNAYESFEGQIAVTIRAVDCGRTVVVEQTVDYQAGPAFDPESENAVTAESVDVIDKEPPNVVRRESGQPVPVMTESSDGRKEVRHVKYSRKGK